MYVIMDIKQVFATMSLVLKLALLATCAKAFSLALISFNMDLSLLMMCSFHLRNWCILIPNSFSVATGLTTTFPVLILTSGLSACTVINIATQTSTVFAIHVEGDISPTWFCSIVSMNNFRQIIDKQYVQESSKN